MQRNQDVYFTMMPQSKISLQFRKWKISSVLNVLLTQANVYNLCNKKYNYCCILNIENKSFVSEQWQQWLLCANMHSWITVESVYSDKPRDQANVSYCTGCQNIHVLFLLTDLGIEIFVGWHRMSQNSCVGYLKFHGTVIAQVSWYCDSSSSTVLWWLKFHGTVIAHEVPWYCDNSSSTVLW